MKEGVYTELRFLATHSLASFVTASVSMALTAAEQGTVGGSPGDVMQAAKSATEAFPKPNRRLKD